MAKVLQRLTGCVSTLGSSPMWARKVRAGTCKYVHDADAFDSLFVSFLFCALCRWQLLGLSSVHVPSVPHGVRRLVTALSVLFLFAISQLRVMQSPAKWEGYVSVGSTSMFTCVCLHPHPPADNLSAIYRNFVAR